MEQPALWHGPGVSCWPLQGTSVHPQEEEDKGHEASPLL